VRRAIEMRTAALAAQHATAAQAQRIVALADALGSCEPGAEATTEADIGFHLAIAEASGNFLIQQIVVSSGPLMRVAVPHARRTRQTAEDRIETVARHQRLAHAIAAGDSAGAERWMLSHFDEAIRALLK